MTIKLMQNTTIFCLKRLDSCGWLNPRTIARDRWPKSAQTDKKAESIRKHLNLLARHGFAFRVGDYFEISDAGREASKMASQGQRPFMLGLAG